MNGQESQLAAEKYADARVLERKSGHESAIIAGYSPSTNPYKIEQSEQVKSAMEIRRAKLDKALAAEGVDETWLVRKVRDGAEEALNGEEKDINGLAQLTKQAAFLLGHGAKPTSPQVAVQINNTNSSSNPGNDSTAAPGFVDRVEALIAILEAQGLGERSADVLPGSPESRDAEAHPGLGGSSEGQGKAGGGGQP